MSIESNMPMKAAALVLATIPTLGGCQNATAAPSAESAVGNPPELGRVQWHRDFDSAQRKARKQGRAMLVLFQEVPGCSTCVNYGQEVLGHPLIVEAAETLFIPAAVFNNVKGHDEKILKHFGEPSLNNPVVRIIDADEKPLAPRVARDYSVGGLASAMKAALEKSGKDVPAYLRILAEEQAARDGKSETATFAMHCFWEGEGALGAIDGVVRTMPGFVGGLEVVEVEFDPQTVSFEKLLGQARKFECASKVFSRTDGQQKIAGRLVGSDAVRSDEAVRPDKQPKYYLSRTEWRHVPMTELQACRVNAALGRKQDPAGFLSPRQNAMFAAIKKHGEVNWPVAIGVEIRTAWDSAKKALQGK